jgi:hypothetical protein
MPCLTNLVGSLGTRLGNRRHTAATAETTGCWLTAHHASDSQPRGYSRSAVSLQPLDFGNGLFGVHSVSISNICTATVKRDGIK